MGFGVELTLRAALPLAVSVLSWSNIKGTWALLIVDSPEVVVLIDWARGGFARCHQQYPCGRIFGT